MRGKIALKALETINGARQQMYGAPEDSFSSISKLWNAYDGSEKDAHDVAILMALMKLARIRTGSGGFDSYLDAIGYIALAADMAGYTMNFDVKAQLDKLREIDNERKPDKDE